MQVLKVLFTLFFTSLLDPGYTQDLKDMSFPDILKLSEDTSRLSAVREDDVKFYVFNRNIAGVHQYDGNSYTIDTQKDIKLLVHGWLNNREITWYRNVTEAYLAREDCNVIQVDWNRIARSAYISAAVGTKAVGQLIADFIKRSNLDPARIHIIGHSLGAHIAGFAGKALKKYNKMLSRITGLDPAGPYFGIFRQHPQERLSKDDAQVVDSIHTDGGKYGVDFPVGTIDIVVNGGYSPQPGCIQSFATVTTLGEALEQGFCSHSRATYYFLEWINGGSFDCMMCPHWSSTSADCPNHIKLADHLDGTITGICKATTNSHAPYLS
nr:unnamed protein product [Callosobruchus chinensis]